MDQIHKDALRRTRVALVKDLNVDYIADHLITADIFTSLMMEYIMAERTRIDKVRRLLDDLVRRGPNAYKSFLDVLNSTGNEFLANKIVRNEETVRREKDPHSSIPIQEISGGHPSMEHSQNSIQCTSNNAQQIPSVSNVSISFGSSSTTASGSRLSDSNSPKSNFQSPAGGLIVHETDSNEEDILDLNPGSTLNPTSMDIDDDDSILLSDGQERQPVQPSDDPFPRYSLSVEPQSLVSMYAKTSSMNKCYKMESNPRGVVLIINNSIFEKDYGQRQGTEHDRRKLEELFRGLSFKVFVKENLKASAMLKEFKELAKDPLLAQVDCMVLAVLSHGTTDNVICGTDGQGIDVMKNIIPIFSAKNCPNLCGKPKMYICNACRGDKTAQSFEIDTSEIKLGRRMQVDELQRDGPRSSPLERKQYLETQDILLCFSTFPGYTSYRDPEEGTWFIQEFVKVFEEQSHDEHVMDMLTEINKRVSQKKHQEHASESTCVQMPFPASSLTDKWYLNPPLLTEATGFSH